MYLSFAFGRAFGGGALPRRSTGEEGSGVRCTSPQRRDATGKRRRATPRGRDGIPSGRIARFGRCPARLAHLSGCLACDGVPKGPTSPTATRERTADDGGAARFARCQAPGSTGTADSIDDYGKPCAVGLRSKGDTPDLGVGGTELDTTQTDVRRERDGNVRWRDRRSASAQVVRPRGLDSSARKIVDTVTRAGATVVGPVPLPTEKNVVVVIRWPHKYKDSREHFEMRTHKRLIDIIDPTPKAVDSLMRLDLPADVNIEIKL